MRSDPFAISASQALKLRVELDNAQGIEQVVQWVTISIT